jgi:putrescine aminotransferase
MITSRQLFLRHLAQTSDAPLMLEIEKAEGIYMFGSNGKKYLDLISGIGVSNVGHRHPKVVEAVKAQLDKYMHLMVYGELVQSPQIMLAQRLSQTLPDSLDNVYFVNSGSEAVEGALKLAKRYTGRREIIYFDNAYHGSSHGALSINGSEYFKQAYRPLLPETRMIRFNCMDDLEHITEHTAAVVIETVQGEAGVKEVSSGYFKLLEKKCRSAGALLIADEIQSGFGRTGRFWAFEHYDIVPDIIVAAKGMGGGMPIGAFIAPKAIMSALMQEPALGHITTFGGHPVSCAASLAVMDVLSEEALIETVAGKEALFRELLQHPRIRAIRSKGLMMALDFGTYAELKKIIDRTLELGVLTDWFLHCNHAMRIAPPLTITHDEIRIACAILNKAMSEDQ